MRKEKIMSYRAMLNFRQTKDFMGLIQEVYAGTRQDMGSLLLNMWPELPSYNQKPKPTLSMVGYAMDARTIQVNLVRNFLFWPQYNLAAIIGDERGLGPSTYELFPGKLFFQNQSDNDYELDTYDPIGLFAQVRDSVLEGTASTYDYAVRTEVYDAITNMLGLEKWIYDEPTPEIQTISTSFVRGQADDMYIRERYAALFEKIKKGHEESNGMA